MPRFHFEIVDGYTIDDPVGLDCKSEAEAIEVAQRIARQIESDVTGTGARKVSVKTDEEFEVRKIPIKR